MHGRTGVEASIGWCCLLAALVLGCGDGMPADPSRDNGQNFGEKFFNVVCQRVAYTSSVQSHARSLAANAKDPKVSIRPLDVSGSWYRLPCRYGDSHLDKQGWAAAWAKDPKVATMIKNRARLVKATNLIFPSNELSSLQDYMVKILPLTDNDKFPNLINKVASIIRTDLELDGALHMSLVRLDRRVGYRPRTVCLGILREALQYKDLHPLLNKLLAFAGEGGVGHEPLMQLLDALAFELKTARRVDDKSLAKPVHQGAADRSLRLGLDLLMTQDSRLATKAKPMLLVRRDWRGVARVRVDPKTGKLPAPFVDKNGDRLADIDNYADYVTAGGKPVPLPFVYDGTKGHAPGRDGQGRALDAAGKLIFDYVNLDTTMLAALSRDAVEIMDYKKDVAMELPLGMAALMGPRKAMTKTVGNQSLTYQGFDTTLKKATPPAQSKAPLLDLAHAVFTTLRDPNIAATLDGAKQLLSKHESQTARLVDAVLKARDTGKKYPGAKLSDDSLMWDQSVVVLQKVAAKKGLMEDLIKALAVPRTRNLGVMFANYMKYRDVHILGPKNVKVVNKSDGKAAAFRTPVDRGKPDTGPNRSIQQRLSHIINNTNGMKMCNKDNACLGIRLNLGPLSQDLCIYKFKKCKLFKVDNGAVFYTSSIARRRDSKGKLTNTPKGHLQMNLPKVILDILKTFNVSQDVVLEMISGIKGMGTHPTTEALNRLMFMPKYPDALAMLQDVPVDIDGHKLNSYHEGSLVSWEARHPQFSCKADDPCQFFDAIRPVVQAFADHDSEKLFVDLLSVMHRHYATKASKTHQFADPKVKDFAYGSGMATWEPLIVEVLGQGDLMPALNGLSVVLKDLKLSNGKPALPALAASSAFILDPTVSPPLSYRNGSTVARGNDNKPISCGSSSCVTPFYLFADAFAARRTVLAAARKGKDKLLADAWDSSTSDLADIFLLAERKGAQYRFKNRRMVASSTMLVDFLLARIAAHRKAGDLDQWANQLSADLARKLEGPVLARAVDFVKVVRTNDTMRKALYDVLDYLINELDYNTAFRASVTGIADLMQLLIDDVNLVPMSRAAGRVIDRKTGLILAALRFLKPAIAADEKHILSGVLRNTALEQTPGKSPVNTLFEVASEVHRLNPGAGTRYGPADFANVFKETRDFLEHKDTGLAKFFEIIKNRCGGDPCVPPK